MGTTSWYTWAHRVLPVGIHGHTGYYQLVYMGTQGMQGILGTQVFRANRVTQGVHGYTGYKVQGKQGDISDIADRIKYLLFRVSVTCKGNRPELP